MNALRSCILPAFFLCSFAQYPSTFPFENEAFVPPTILQATPNLAFDASDPGGYIYHYAYTLDLTDEWWTKDQRGEDTTGFGYVPQNNGFAQYMLAIHFEIDPWLPLWYFNCTLWDQFFTPEDFSGVIDSKTVCISGECCSNVFGLIKWNDDEEGLELWLSEKVALNMCGDVTEELYCMIVEGEHQLNCYEVYISVTDRSFNAACPDTIVLLYLTCPVLTTGGVELKYDAEPLNYMAKLTPEETFAVEAVFFLQDRVCMPYSYYHPQATVPSSSSSAASSSSNSSATDSSSANSYNFLLLSVLALL